MTLTVQTFMCPRCRRGEFRSLPGQDGKAFCPWCGDAVAASDAPPPPPPAPEPPAVSPPRASAPLEDVAELKRRCERAESALQQELDKKEGIKRAVMGEMGRQAAQLGEARDLLRRKEEEHRAALADAGRWKEDLEKERKQAVEASEKSAQTERELRHSVDVWRRDAEEIRAHLETARASFDAEATGLRKAFAAGEARLAALKGAEAELNDLKNRVKDQRRLLEKERAESQEKAAALQAELEKRDQRVHELQALIKTLGERLNELSRRHHV